MAEDRLKTPGVDDLLAAITSTESREEAYALLLDLCTIREIQDMAQRLEVARMLAAGEHYSAIQENGYRTLNEGEVVEFDLLKGPKGYQAANVVRGQRMEAVRNAALAQGSAAQPAIRTQAERPQVASNTMSPIRLKAMFCLMIMLVLRAVLTVSGRWVRSSCHPMGPKKSVLVSRRNPYRPSRRWTQRLNGLQPRRRLACDNWRTSMPEPAPIREYSAAFTQTWFQPVRNGDCGLRPWPT